MINIWNNNNLSEKAKSINALIEELRLGKYEIYPSSDKVFRAFELTSFENLKVVILGQDPYIGENQATGLAFEVPLGTKSPPSLINIHREILTDVGKTNVYPFGTFHAKQGVLLLNTALTVFKGISNSHNHYWKDFIADIIQTINTKNNVVWLLWGNYAKSYNTLITNSTHLKLESAHPSPLARGAFFGCKHFSKCNKFLEENNIQPIIW